MNKDTVVGILGAVILVAAMVGIFYYEGTQAPTGVAGPGPGGAGGTFRNGTVALSDVEGDFLAEGSSAEHTVQVTQTNMTGVDFTVTWSDDNAQAGADTFRVTVTPPVGAPRSEEGNGGSVTVSFANLTAPGTASNLTGAWRVSVEMVSAPDLTPVPDPGLPVPVPNPTADNGNAYSLGTSVRVWERA